MTTPTETAKANAAALEALMRCRRDVLTDDYSCVYEVCIHAHGHLKTLDPNGLNRAANAFEFSLCAAIRYFDTPPGLFEDYRPVRSIADLAWWEDTGPDLADLRRVFDHAIGILHPEYAALDHEALYNAATCHENDDGLWVAGVPALGAGAVESAPMETPAGAIVDAHDKAVATLI